MNSMSALGQPKAARSKTIPRAHVVDQLPYQDSPPTGQDISNCIFQSIQDHLKPVRILRINQPKISESKFMGNSLLA